MERGQRELGSRRRREGGGQTEARVTSYKQVGIIVSRINDARNVNTTKSASHSLNVY